jgi:hypothetical protein
VWYAVGTDASWSGAAAGGGPLLRRTRRWPTARSARSWSTPRATPSGFTNDAEAVGCTGDCAATWPALLVEGDPALGEGLDPAHVHLVAEAEATSSSRPASGRCTASRATRHRDVNGRARAWFAVAADGRWSRTRRPTVRRAEGTPDGGY